MFKRFFNKKKSLVLGGKRSVSVTDWLDREIGRIYYEVPESDMVLEYVYEMQKGLADDKSKIKEISDAENKALSCHKIVWRELSLPYAKKVFLGAEVYKLQSGEDISSVSVEDQFNHIKKYCSNHLSDMCSIAFSQEGKVKKND